MLALLDTESVVRSAAAAALEQLDRNWLNNPVLRPVLPKVKNALGHHDYWVRNSATKLFAQLKMDPEQVLEETATDPAAEQTHPSFSILQDLLLDHDRDLRLAAAMAFGHLQEQNARAILTAATQDSDPNVRHAARQSLAALE